MRKNCFRDKQEKNSRSWFNKLQEDQKRIFGKDEDDLIFKLHALLGNRWSLIAGRLPGRTATEVKNHWNSHLRRNLLRWQHLRRYSAHLAPWLNHCRCCANKSFSSGSTRCSLEDDATSLPVDLKVGPSTYEENHEGLIEDAAPN